MVIITQRSGQSGSISDVKDVCVVYCLPCSRLHCEGSSDSGGASVNGNGSSGNGGSDSGKSWPATANNGFEDLFPLIAIVNLLILGNF